MMYVHTPSQQSAQNRCIEGLGVRQPASDLVHSHTVLWSGTEEGEAAWDVAEHLGVGAIHFTACTELEGLGADTCEGVKVERKGK